MQGDKNSYLFLSDEEILKDCDIHVYKASGPGGQHRNKVSSAIRLKHRPTSISATANDSRSQQENRKLAMKRLRMNLALRIRNPLNIAEAKISEVVAECIFEQAKGQAPGKRKMQIGRKDHRFWQVASFLLDCLAGAEGRLGDVAAFLGISTGNLSNILKSERHLFSATQEIRKANNLKPIS